ncbi:MAG: U32 family peptidase [Fidelibacterota bacterium]
MQTIHRRDIEIIAPVGSWESLRAAIQGNADAVYFGIEQLNMRSGSATNFRLDDLTRVITIAHAANLKTYLTLNTILYDRDLRQMQAIVDRAKTSGVDAVIATDPAALTYIRHKGLPVHLSTQANVSNLEALRFYAQFADLIVPARELTLEQIRTIATAIESEQICGPSGAPVRLELFVHGALCMAISGKCYLSLHQANHSANRGECLQICRRAYIARDKETGAELEIDHEFIMSPKDLMTIHFLDKILAAGVNALKIEGRARPPEYVRTVCECYSHAVSAVCEGCYSAEKIKDWQKRLAMVFNRGFWDGYYLGQRLGEWSSSYGSQATRRRCYLGKGVNYFKKQQVAEFIIEAGSLSVGERVLITGPTTGVMEIVLDEIWVAENPVRTAGKGDHVTFRLASPIRPSDRLYKLVNVS